MGVPPQTSPDGSVRIEWEIHDGRMSHVIRSARARWVATGEVLFEFGWDWDGEVHWLEGCAFLIHLRRYTMGGGLTVWIDPGRRSFRIGGERGVEEPMGTRAEFEARIEAEHRSTVEYRGELPEPAKTPWRAIVLITLAALAAIAALTAASLWYQEQNRAKFVRPVIPVPPPTAPRR